MTASEGAESVRVPARVPSLELVEGPDSFQVNLGNVATEARALLDATHRLHGVDVTLDLPDDAAVARVSRRRAGQVMLLLLAHAADHAGGQGVRFVVEPPDDFGDEGPRFAVRTPDARLSGRELNTALLSPVLAGPRHRQLARARELAEAMGGELVASCDERSGLCITVSLPSTGLSSW
ncbi:sensor histidine kinase [Myxococcus sp. K15C18031901]|uniref:sensor histidine kinase n=1 Tax=Myxococcus dinghuensis TaxID=2906761 RepID=UPI0020A72BF8|nr:sensor histidine kinase [Myxococcus dinghuensis]MCP3099568.1 sensor histidine kinase [Myxococcus dinghuensis]